ncbi:MAG: hypothetical protein AAF999_02995 [Pseudomonadota bacterium]
MGYPTKIATCCYCGARAALVLGKDRHELTCASCGAPLHDMKKLRQTASPKKPQKSYVHETHKPPMRAKYERYQKPRKKYRKKRKGLMRHLIEEAFDVIEDIFD